MGSLAVGNIVQTDTGSLNLSPQNVGGLFLVEVICVGTTSDYCTGISGGGATWSQVGTRLIGTANTNTAALFAGKVTATGPATATLNFNNTPPAIRCAGQEFSPVTAWTLDLQGNLDGPGTNAMPTLNPSKPNELYFGYEYDSGSATAGSTPGYTYEVDVHGNGLLFNPNCGANAQTPTWASSACVFGIAVLIKETVYSGLMMANSL